MVDRVYERNATQSAPQAPQTPSAGYPTDGNPAQGIPATIPGAYWYHMILESLVALVSKSGQQPDHTDLQQVVEAVSRLSARGVTTVTSADSPKSLTVAEAGLVLVDASAGDVTLNLPASAGNKGLGYTIARTDSSANAVTVTPDGTNPDTIEGAASLSLTVSRRLVLIADGVTDWTAPVLVATDAEAQAFDAGRLIDGAALLAAFKGGNQNLADSGYQRLPGGLIIQWGKAATDSQGFIAAFFPIAFPNAFLGAVLTEANADSATGGLWDTDTATVYGTNGNSTLTEIRGAGRRLDPTGPSKQAGMAVQYFAFGY
ncbi:gp53-like domain-containing protein [Marinobacter subterrani]|uniref:Putative tail fiber protein gp53-like C-terminal domain-containing protein n=1 Tax=Marinobacter subterrani TaxID=1658765 RepID=A0A0J7J331_9GAMM|nr:hypothetical protein [Marinobacter subterrani]KMQ72833.1 hypothetical protein Msub_20027 [Marinobacter subterrani]